MSTATFTVVGSTEVTIAKACSQDSLRWVRIMNAGPSELTVCVTTDYLATPEVVPTYYVAPGHTMDVYGGTINVKATVTGSLAAMSWQSL